jgi:hypothetical protein
MAAALKDDTYLANAQLAAGFMASHQAVVPPGGGASVLDDGPDSSCGDATCAQFKGIAFR